MITPDLAEKRHTLATQVLQLLSQSDEMADTIHRILLLMKGFTGFEAVGIRLRDGEDFPYYTTTGFPGDFVEAERYLCQCDRMGEVVRDSQGNAYLECMCGNVISGRTDPTLSFFSEGGSFWTNSTTELLASTTEEDRQARTRNRCNGEGYESVALIPLRSRDEIVGLLQLNDSRPNMLTCDMVDFLEGVGPSIGIVLVRKNLEEGLLKSRDELERRVDERTVELAKVVERLRTEMTERRRVEEELRHTQKMEAIGTLAAGIAHEINTPTQYVSDNTSFIKDALEEINPLFQKLAVLIDTEKNMPIPPELVADLRAEAERAELDYLTEEIPRAVHETLEGIERISRIVRAMKQFSHPSTEKAAADINRGIESTITVTTNEWKYVAEMVADLDPELPLVSCIQGDINQVILNMVVNAAHAIADVVGDGSQGKGTITISTRKAGEWAEIRVSDTGAGIPKDIIGRVFDPFFTTKKVGKGTGQGLNIAHTVVVQKHQGTLSVESEVGKGTTFLIRLPMTDPVMDTEGRKAKERSRAPSAAPPTQVEDVVSPGVSTG